MKYILFAIHIKLTGYFWLIISSYFLDLHYTQQKLIHSWTFVSTVPCRQSLTNRKSNYTIIHIKLIQTNFQSTNNEIFNSFDWKIDISFLTCAILQLHSRMKQTRRAEIFSTGTIKKISGCRPLKNKTEQAIKKSLKTKWKLFNNYDFLLLVWICKCALPIIISQLLQNIQKKFKCAWMVYR